MNKALRLVATSVLLTLFLSACLSTGTLSDAQKANLTPDAKLFALKSDYVVALRTLAPYLRQQECNLTQTTACKNPVVVKQLQEIDREICGPPPLPGQKGCSANSAFGIASASDGNAQLAAIQAVRALILRYAREIAMLGVTQ